ncbi:MAG: sialidase family protein [Lacibacter sp.]
MKKAIAFIVITILFQQLQAQQLHYIFQNGENGYQCFRIPAIITTNNATVLAFAEARKNNCSDAGDIDLVVKRSTDNGKTWSKLQVVWSDGENTCGNPAPVVDQRTGNIFLLSTWNLGTDHESDIINQKSKDTRRIFLLSSTDDGINWSSPKEITKDVKQDDWTWYATGPVNGIQIRKGRYKNRLVIPCDHIEAATKKYFSHIIYSDDGGNNWKLGGSTPQDKVNECTVAELPGKTLMLNMRNYSGNKLRQVSLSKDGGITWTNLKADTALPEPICQGSLLWYSFPKQKSFLAFSNPDNKTGRTNMTIKISYNKGRSWFIKKVLYNGPSAYSNLVVMPNGNLGCLFEAGLKSPYEGIVFEEIDTGN